MAPRPDRFPLKCEVFFVSPAWIGLFLFFCLAPLLGAATLICKKSTDAFNPEKPSQLIGRFEPGSKLEVGEWVPTAKMYIVVFNLPDGHPINALCHAKDLGMPEVQARSIPAEWNAYLEDPQTPPLFKSLLQIQPDIWNTPSSRFALLHSRFGFAWVTSVDTSTSRSGNKLSFLTYPVYESIARFTEGKLSEISLLIYGRGDAQEEPDKANFDIQIDELTQTVDNWTGMKGVNAWVKPSGADMKRTSWFATPLRLDLEWSVTPNAKETREDGSSHTRFRPEFIRLVASPYDGVTRIAELTQPDFSKSNEPPIRLKDLPARLLQEANGDLYLKNFPMVDQGQKGYCVAASSERLLRYYNIDIDQNEIAKLANVERDGTTPDAMYRALKKVGGRYSLVAREIRHFSSKDFFRETKEYNDLARRRKSDEILLPPSGSILVESVYEKMDPHLLREIRLKKEGDVQRFDRQIRDLIDKGAPALWAVQLGFVDEIPKLPQERGGHMRLIIGYNPRNNELIYTDSWGAGHEFKRMPIEDAYFITTGLYSVLPGS